MNVDELTCAITASPEGRRPSRVPIWPAVVTVVAMASLPYLSILATNVDQGVETERVLIWWLGTLAVGLAVVALAARLGRRTAGWVGALTGVALYLFFNYPAIIGLRETVGLPVSDVVWWALVSAVVLAVAIPVTRMRTAQRSLAVLAPALLLLPLVQLVSADLSADESHRPRSAAPAATFESTTNVYWFVLDGLAGPPFLQEEVGMDPDPFVAYLRGRGFDVLEDARSNYPFTHLALASALEMEYLYEDVPEPAQGPYYERLRGNNRTVDTFLANGYRYVHTYPGFFGSSRCSGREDLCFGDHGALGETDWALMSATPLVDVLVDEETHESIATTNDPLHVTDVVLSSAPEPPYFALAHLLNPHPPYLRDADCRIRDVPLALGAWGDGPEYEEAVTCLFGRLEAAVDRILEADEDPLIIIQGDHGPRFGLDPSPSGKVLLDDEMFFSAFSAIRLPERCAGLDVPDDLTIVNTFRVVFACLEDRSPNLLPDRVFPIERDY